MRMVGHPSLNEHGSGRNTTPEEKKRVILGGYALVEPGDEGQRRQSRGGTLVETPEGYRYCMWIEIEDTD